MHTISLMLLVLQLVFAFASVVSADHDADWFRSTNSGRHNSLDLSKGLEDQVAATTCLSDSFVRVNGRRFEVGGEEFIFAGWNQWEMMEQATGAGPPARHTPLSGREHIVRLLNEGVKTGLKVIRVWAHLITPGQEVQSEPGVWNEERLRGLDFFIDEARKRRLRLVIVLADNWYVSGGVDNYVKWSGSAQTHQDFFIDSGAKRIFKDMISTITNRQNTITGIRYADDPTIMSYNLINEARCQNCPAETMGRWIDEMARFLKLNAPNQLVGLGYEGFFHESDPEDLRATNPGVGSNWAAKEGQSWLRHSRLKSIDYTSIHVWPDNWSPKTVEFMKSFIRSRIDLAQSVGKPFVLEEFGKKVDRSAGEAGFVERDQYFSAAFEIAERAARDGELSGTIFWHWYDRGIGLTSRYGIHSDETTFELVKRHAKRMNIIGNVRDFCSYA
ncbi:Glycoside hydrolase, catalytic domain [Ostreococcus tauri]|uniref:mannan endo-1,4-beta-mannosidase n=1 Tax=Ostreococcus tauri TaxID=70448 RepID=A0A090M020_OSTTA|nr:Glycoside hydrolase, catalytic domain [Ostreococcus tauri]CEF97526.1 Glycoside hydrolase, catalytic domain [Ostreococcus tauri]|eukprot:XP_003078701.2 Glycoside hydrolase, catalytic domain [Ostreococcus tauri]